MTEPRPASIGSSLAGLPHICRDLPALGLGFDGSWRRTWGLRGDKPRTGIHVDEHDELSDVEIPDLDALQCARDRDPAPGQHRLHRYLGMGVIRGLSAWCP